MKHFKRQESPRFKNRNSFQSPECSTVIEVNPSCESEESMLEKIIFPDHMNSKPPLQPYSHHKEPLRQKPLNSIGLNREIGKLNKNYKYFDQNSDPKWTKVDYSGLNSSENKENFTKRFQSYKSSKEKYEPEKQFADKYPRPRINSLSSTQSLSSFMQKTASKLGSKFESYQSNELRKNFSTQKYKKQYSYNDENNESQTVIDEVKLREIQDKIMRYRQKNRKPGAPAPKELIRQQTKPGSFRDTMESQLNNIQIDLLPSQQNRLKKKQTIIDNISLLDKDYSPYQNLEKGSETISRMPGKLLSQNKTLNRKESQVFQCKRFELTDKIPACTQNKRYESREKEVANPSNTFRNYSEFQNVIDIPIMQDLSVEKRIERAKKISKKVYMEPTQKTENDEIYQPRYRESYETEIDMNEKALVLMLQEERAKKYVPSSVVPPIIEKEIKRDFIGEDDELERLNNLEKRFNQHFNSKK